ncbi:MAG: fatty acid hydroxylase [Deltaproteobacteria bacterium RBG_19FT_COMBO_46_12]|nr:MAG: fatty acid hydroxylase [Deltaproteobacteria bacterium RBG_19FT_COMBO_46_12]
MMNLILTYDGAMRLLFFIGVLTVMASWEILAPRRILSTPKNLRWYSNLGLVFLDTLALRVLLPMQAVGIAEIAQHRGWGLLNNLSFPSGLEIVIGVVVLDFIIYLQHAMFHFIPLFWRLHRVHHTDLDFDVTTGVRFHPIEIFLSMGIKMATVVALGPAPVAVIIFEIILNGTSMFNHGNVRLPVSIDRVLRLFVVTPEMHRVHHSVIIREFNSNFGFSLPWWDRILGTYRAQPEKGHEAMTIGLGQFREPKYITLPWLLILPFIRKP